MGIVMQDDMEGLGRGGTGGRSYMARKTGRGWVYDMRFV